MDEGTLTARGDDLAKPGSRRYHDIDVRVAWPVARTLSTHPGDVAQLGERLVCNQEVGGSIPLVSTLKAQKEQGLTAIIGRYDSHYE